MQHFQDIPDLLGPEGPFARQQDGFAPRRQQQDMAEAVAAAIDTEGVLLAEAGTGTGKTYAYLVPAALSGKKVLISTGTRNLQDQLFQRDIPEVRRVLGIGLNAAVLKGRANYLCRYRMQRTEQDGRFTSRDTATHLRRVVQWEGRTQSGDIAELGDVPEDSPIWPQVTSTAENCLGSDCPEFTGCFVVRARKLAQEADLLVVNHHLFLADVALREEGFGEVLPGVNVCIFDEAHQLPDIAGNFFGQAVSSRQLQDLPRDAHLVMLADAPDLGEIADACRALEGAVLDFRLVFGTEPRRAAWVPELQLTPVREGLGKLVQALERLSGMLEPAAVRSKELQLVHDRAEALLLRLETFTAAASEDYIQWFETHQRGFALRATPIDVAKSFRACMEGPPRAWIFTSATLSAGGSFDHFARSLGIEHAEAHIWDSPFNYAEQAVLYLPTGMPEPNSPGYTRAVTEAAIPVIESCTGGTFVLVTSWRALREASDLLRRTLSCPLLVQGDMPRQELLERFRQAGNAVLVGTSSFWEGVDVRGAALSCVVIDKLPFAAPDDPVLQARLDALRAHGGNPFTDHQLPRAVVALKQGAGRLIRDVGDRGVLMLCDPRLLGKSYGRVFLASLPPMHRTRDLAEVQNFFGATVA